MGTGCVFSVECILRVGTDCVYLVQCPLRGHWLCPGGCVYLIQCILCVGTGCVFPFQCVLCVGAGESWRDHLQHNMMRAVLCISSSAHPACGRW